MQVEALDAGEDLEDPLQIFRIDPNPVITDLNDDIAG
jgi:hypothetical protein